MPHSKRPPPLRSQARPVAVVAVIAAFVLAAACTSPRGSTGGSGQSAGSAVDATATATDVTATDVTATDVTATADAAARIPLAPPAKCAFKNKSCLSPCLDSYCASEEAACEANEDCHAVSQCVKNKCEWSAWKCIQTCIYKTGSAKGGNLYMAMTGCAADHCIEQVCGDKICLGDETPASCPRDCRVGDPGPGSCEGRCGAYLQGATCQCDKVCDEVGDCCGDKVDVCEVPDVALLSVSGHDIIWPSVSVDYLSEPGDAVSAVKGKLKQWGLKVRSFGFVDGLYDHDDDGDGVDDRLGFLSLVEVMGWIRDHWVIGQKHPVRIILIAHSHGAVWAHAATSIVPDLPIRVLITLDGTCLEWENLHANAIIAYVNKHGVPWDWDVWNACDTWPIPELKYLADTEDVVCDSVETNLEVQAGALSGLDPQSNHRVGGGKAGIVTAVSPDEGHTGVHRAKSSAMTWVIEELTALWF